MARYVCPTCGHDDRLYSVEQAEVMYPIKVGRGREVDYESAGTGPDVLLETAQFADLIFCRGCDGEFALANLKKVKERDAGLSPSLAPVTHSLGGTGET